MQNSFASFASFIVHPLILGCCISIPNVSISVCLSGVKKNSSVFYLLRYSTIYTMFPVFSLVLDKDVKSEVAMLYPELYKDLLKV